MAILNGLCTLAEARASLNLASTDTANDSDIEKYISAVTPLIEHVTGPLYLREETVTLDGGRDALVLPFRFVTVSSITVDGSAVTDYIPDPSKGIIYADGSWFSSGRQNIVVTVIVGAGAIPPDVNLAAREAFRELWQIGRQGNRPSFGNEPVADAAVASQGYVMGKRVMALLAAKDDLPGFA